MDKDGARGTVDDDFDSSVDSANVSGGSGVREDERRRRVDRAGTLYEVTIFLAEETFDDLRENQEAITTRGEIILEALLEKFRAKCGPSSHVLVMQLADRGNEDEVRARNLAARGLADAADAALAAARKPLYNIHMFFCLKEETRNMRTMKAEVEEIVKSLRDEKRSHSADEGADVDDYRFELRENSKVTRAKSQRNALKSITFANFVCIMTNVPEKDLSTVVGLDECLKRSDELGEICYRDPYVKRHWTQYNYLNKAVQQESNRRQRELVSRAELRPIDVDSCRVGWTKRCAMVWNERVLSDSREPRAHKQLYLHGVTTLGKSRFVEDELIGPGMEGCICRPEKGRFFMQDFDEKRHKVIFFDDFKMDDYLTEVNDLRRLTGAEPHKYAVKGKSAKFIQFFGPVIFASNEMNINDDPLLRRLAIVHATVPSWTENTAVVGEDDAVRREHEGEEQDTAVNDEQE